nr:uncharacterized protein LOC117600377 isoform X1 [Osmia lignaria]
MSRPRERLSRRWSTLDTTSKRKDSTSSGESSSPTNDIEYSPPVKSTSTPLRNRWSDLEEINRSPQTRHARGKVEDIETTSSDETRLQRHKVARGKHQDNRERAKKGRYDRRGKRKHDRQSEELENEKQKETATSESSEKDNGEGDAECSKRKRRGFREDNELPITEILRRSQENARTKYEQQPPFPVLTTDKIYVQYRDGFSAMKINQSKESRDRDKEGTVRDIDIPENQSSPPIRIAVLIQKFWKKTGLVYQGLLGGMALMHFIMLHIFFDTSMEFVAEYSMISEIYSSIFSLLVTLSIVSSFDKFDLARFDVEHLREIYLDYNKAVIAVPLYLITFCLHQVSLKIDNQLSLARYRNSNDSLLENVSRNKVFPRKISSSNVEQFHFRSPTFRPFWTIYTVGRRYLCRKICLRYSHGCSFLLVPKTTRFLFTYYPWKSMRTTSSHPANKRNYFIIFIQSSFFFFFIRIRKYDFNNFIRNRIGCLICTIFIKFLNTNRQYMYT